MPAVYRKLGHTPMAAKSFIVRINLTFHSEKRITLRELSHLEWSRNAEKEKSDRNKKKH